jgi:hypothetical protein
MFAEIARASGSAAIEHVVVMHITKAIQKTQDFSKIRTGTFLHFGRQKLTAVSPLPFPVVLTH